EHRVEDLPADIVEVDVNALRAVLSQGGRDVLTLVVDRRVEAEVLDHMSALLRAARDPDDAAAPQLGDLPGHAADRAGGARDYDRLAGLRLADPVQPEVCGHPGHA